MVFFFVRGDCTILRSKLIIDAILLEAPAQLRHVAPDGGGVPELAELPRVLRPPGILSRLSGTTTIIMIYPESIEDFAPSEAESIQAFVEICAQGGLFTRVRQTRGTDISGLACH